MFVVVLCTVIVSAARVTQPLTRGRTVTAVILLGGVGVVAKRGPAIALPLSPGAEY